MIRSIQGGADNEADMRMSDSTVCLPQACISTHFATYCFLGNCVCLTHQLWFWVTLDEHQHIHTRIEVISASHISKRGTQDLALAWSHFGYCIFRAESYLEISLGAGSSRCFRRASLPPLVTQDPWHGTMASQSQLKIRSMAASYLPRSPFMKRL